MSRFTSVSTGLPFAYSKLTFSYRTAPRTGGSSMASGLSYRSVFTSSRSKMRAPDDIARWS